MTDGIPIYMQITYSKERREEMRQTHEKNCQLLIGLLQRELAKAKIKDFHLSIPRNNDRKTDIVLEFTADNEEDTSRVENLVRKHGGTSVGEISTFILEE